MLTNDKIVTIQGHFFLITPVLSMFLTSTCYFWSLEYWVKDLRLTLITSRKPLKDSEQRKQAVSVKV